MSPQDLKVFLAVAEASGVNRAAPFLGRVASNVSTRIAHIEREVGTPLFIRSNVGMSLTREGELLRTHAYRVLRAHSDAAAALNRKERVSMLRVGVVPSVSIGQLSTQLASFAAKHPGCDLRLEYASSRELQAKLVHGELDGAVCDSGQVSLDGLQAIPIGTETLALVGPRGWDGRPHRRGISFGPECGLQQRLEGWYRRRNSAPLQYLTAPNYDHILCCVIGGGAVAVVPSSVIAKHDCEGLLTVFPLPPPSDAMFASFVYSPAREPAGLLACMQPATEASTSQHSQTAVAY